MVSPESVRVTGSNYQGDNHIYANWPSLLAGRQVGLIAKDMQGRSLFTSDGIAIKGFEAAFFVFPSDKGDSQEEKGDVAIKIEQGEGEEAANGGSDDDEPGIHTFEDFIDMAGAEIAAVLAVYAQLIAFFHL